MSVLLVFEILVYLLAVYGIYALVCRLFYALTRRGRISLALSLDGEEEPTAVAEAVRELGLLSEHFHGRFTPPVILLSDTPEGEQLALLFSYGYPIYILHRREEDT
jgi:hypothetical protein